MDEVDRNNSAVEYKGMVESMVIENLTCLDRGKRVLLEWTNICLDFLFFQKLYSRRDRSKNFLGVIPEINQNHSIYIKGEFLKAQRFCLAILLGIILLAETISGVLGFYLRDNCSCWVLYWETIIMRKIIRKAIILGCNYTRGNHAGRNYSGCKMGKFTIYWFTQIIQQLLAPRD